MLKYILISFAVMAFAFYELSGGEEFVSIADEKRVALAAERKATELAEAEAKAAREAQLASNSAAETETETTDVQVVLASAPAIVEDTAPTSDELQAAVIAALAANAAETSEVESEGDAVTQDADRSEELAEEIVIASPLVGFEDQKDIREVTAARVNMRDGPGQNFEVLAKLTNGQQVEILQDPGDGWVKLQVVDTGRVGWMADFLLTAANTN